MANEVQLQSDLVAAKIQREKSLANLFDHLSSLVNKAIALIDDSLKTK